MNANEILKKHEDANEMHFHEVDRTWIIEAMEEYAALRQPPVSERFSSEGEILQWLYLNTPFAIKPKSKNAKTLLVSPFTSNHAFEEVCKHLANKLYNAR